MAEPPELALPNFTLHNPWRLAESLHVSKSAIYGCARIPLSECGLDSSRWTASEILWWGAVTPQLCVDEMAGSSSVIVVGYMQYIAVSR
jgi:hypothetical protein